MCWVCIYYNIYIYMLGMHILYNYIFPMVQKQEHLFLEAVKKWDAVKMDSILTLGIADKEHRFEVGSYGNHLSLA